MFGTVWMMVSRSLLHGKSVRARRLRRLRIPRQWLRQGATNVASATRCQRLPHVAINSNGKMQLPSAAPSTLPILVCLAFVRCLSQLELLSLYPPLLLGVAELLSRLGAHFVRLALSLFRGCSDFVGGSDGCIFKCGNGAVKALSL